MEISYEERIKSEKAASLEDDMLLERQLAEFNLPNLVADIKSKRYLDSNIVRADLVPVGIDNLRKLMNICIDTGDDTLFGCRDKVLFLCSQAISRICVKSDLKKRAVEEGVDYKKYCKDILLDLICKAGERIEIDESTCDMLGDIGYYCKRLVKKSEQQSLASTSENA